jgi:hypothetical protein
MNAHPRSRALAIREKALGKNHPLVGVSLDNLAVLLQELGEFAAARPLFEVRAPRADVVVVSDRPPVTASLYQASKLIPPAAALLRERGTVVVAAECADGIGPVEVVNRGIYRLGLLPLLPARHTIRLVSALPPAEVLRSYCRPADSVVQAVRDAGPGRTGVLPRAGLTIPLPED